MTLVLLLAGCTTPTRPMAVNLADFGADGDPFLGNPDAAIQVVAYEAPGCSSCAYYHANGYKEILSDYIETGLIGYHSLQWTVGYGYDKSAGVAEECAFREGGSAAYHFMFDKVMSSEYQRKDAKLPELIDLTVETFGLDSSAMYSCFDNQETLNEVNADIAAGRTSGAGSNPGFAVIKDGKATILRGVDGPRDAIEALL